MRVRRDDLVTFQVDGTHGSAVAGLTRCFTQHRVNTPRPVWNPDSRRPWTSSTQWDEVPDNSAYDNGFKIQWEEFIRHVVAEDARGSYDLIEGAKGVQLAELGLKSWAERRWIDVPAAEDAAAEAADGQPQPADRRRPPRALRDPQRAARRCPTATAAPRFNRVAYAAAHVVADPLADNDPWLDAAIDWDATIAFRDYLWDLGLGVAEAMDTAQRGMGLDWRGAQELIRRALEAAKAGPAR